MRSVLGQLKGSIDKISDWFKKIFLKGNVDKCHLITSSKTPVGIEVSNINVMGEEKVKLLELNFDYQISQLCKKACSNSVFKYINISQRKLIANAFIMFQFSYCPLIWMFHSQAMEHRISRIHERTLRLIYPNQHQLTFKELLEEKNKTVRIHQRNLQTLATEIFKTKNKVSSEVLNSLFEFSNKNYNLRNASVLKRKRYGNESLLCLAKIWKLVPDSIREVKTLSIFKNEIKAWKFN